MAKTAPAPKTDFPARRAGAIALGLTLFLTVFQPFGLSLDTPAEWAIVVGGAPLNFAAMLILHHRWLNGLRWRSATAMAALIVLNTAWLSGWSAEIPAIRLVIQVGLIAAAVAAAAAVWTRQRHLTEEILVLRARPAPGPGPGPGPGQSPDATPILLRGEGSGDLLRLPPGDLISIQAQGNYAEVRHTGGTVLLRSSLAGLRNQVPEDLLIQTHRSHLANPNAARRLIRSGRAPRIEMADGSVVPVSRGYRTAVETRLLNRESVDPVH